MMPTPCIRLLAMAVTASLCSCKAPEFYFRTTEHPSLKLVQQMASTANPDIGAIDSAYVYEAILQEDYTERNSVAEKTIYNIDSREARFPLPVIDKEYRLYVILLHTGELHDGVLFLTTAFKGACDLGNCSNIGLGPAYYGQIRMEQLVLNRKLKLTKNTSQYVPTKPTADSIRMLTDRDLEEERLDAFTIKQLMVLTPNKISGNKPMLYQIPQLFADESALRFTYKKTLRK